MKRYRYDSIVKGVFRCIGEIIFMTSIVFFSLSLFFDKSINISSIIFSIIGLAIIFIGFFISLVLRCRRDCVIFSDGKVYFQGKCLYNCVIKYIKLHISFIDPSLVIPKLYVTFDSRVICIYLTKRDVKKLIKAKYEIKIL